MMASNCARLAGPTPRTPLRSSGVASSIARSEPKRCSSERATSKTLCPGSPEPSTSATSSVSDSAAAPASSIRSRGMSRSGHAGADTDMGTDAETGAGKGAGRRTEGFSALLSGMTIGSFMARSSVIQWSGDDAPRSRVPAGSGYVAYNRTFAHGARRPAMRATPAAAPCAARHD
ncbi:hypothetical protein BN2476_200035 [Paraburkholderia piptadeniae]|uniref:Uncharacterized protein n=1 Tax=Paraburkholderia piptadeniae TaxID=1701573 RepID=A0A1N7RUX1_9BURK|nr:hypothetical protein BN2476_200035 [Paraburkholderia piptadeniae]